MASARHAGTGRATIAVRARRRSPAPRLDLDAVGSAPQRGQRSVQLHALRRARGAPRRPAPRAPPASRRRQAPVVRPAVRLLRGHRQQRHLGCGHRRAADAEQRLGDRQAVAIGAVPGQAVGERRRIERARAVGVPRCTWIDRALRARRHRAPARRPARRARRAARGRDGGRRRRRPGRRRGCPCGGRRRPRWPGRSPRRGARAAGSSAPSGAASRNSPPRSTATPPTRRRGDAPAEPIARLQQDDVDARIVQVHPRPRGPRRRRRRRSRRARPTPPRGPVR